MTDTDIVEEARALHAEWADRTDVMLPLSERAAGVGVVDALITGDRLSSALKRVATEITRLRAEKAGERERCAKIAEEERLEGDRDDWDEWERGYEFACIEIAAAIRETET